MHEIKEGIWEGEDLCKCLSCAKPWEVEQETYALSCYCCGETILHEESIATTYHHDSKRKKKA